MPFPTGFIEPCLPLKVAVPPSGKLWVHEIKHDGYWLMLRVMTGATAATPATAMTRPTSSTRRFASTRIRS